jgi:hypothetical protein
MPTHRHDLRSSVGSPLSDRQKELDLKTSLVSQITGSAATDTQDAFTLVGDEAKSASIKDLAWRSEYRRILKEWRVAAFTLESELDACFPHAKVHLLARSRQSSLVPAFRTYNRIIQYYIRLSLDECTTQGGRQGAIKAIYRYLNQQPPHGISDFPIGRVKHGPGCWKKPGTSSIRSCPSSSDLPTRTAFRMAKTSTGGVLRSAESLIAGGLARKSRHSRWCVGAPRSACPLTCVTSRPPPRRSERAPTRTAPLPPALSPSRCGVRRRSRPSSPDDPRVGRFAPAS